MTMDFGGSDFTYTDFEMDTWHDTEQFALCFKSETQCNNGAFGHMTVAFIGKEEECAYDIQACR